MKEKNANFAITNGVTPNTSQKYLHTNSRFITNSFKSSTSSKNNPPNLYIFNTMFVLFLSLQSFAAPLTCEEILSTHQNIKLHELHRQIQTKGVEEDVPACLEKKSLSNLRLGLSKMARNFGLGVLNLKWCSRMRRARGWSRRPPFNLPEL